MASSLSFVGLTYPTQYSQNGKWEVDIALRFTHTSPADGFYSYKIRYWYWDETANGTYSGDFNSARPNAVTTPMFLSEGASSHTDSRSHDYTIYGIVLTAGHTYKFGFEILYNVASWGTTSYEASAMGAVNRTINVKAANEGGSSGTGAITSVSVNTDTNSAAFSVQITHTPSSDPLTVRVYYSTGTVTYDSPYIGLLANSDSWNGTITNLISGTPYNYRVVLCTVVAATPSADIKEVKDTRTGRFTTDEGGGEEPPQNNESISAQYTGHKGKKPIITVRISPDIPDGYYKPGLYLSKSSGVDYQSYDGYYSASYQSWSSGDGDLFFEMQLPGIYDYSAQYWNNFQTNKTYYYRVYIIYSSSGGSDNGTLTELYTCTSELTFKIQLSLLQWSWAQSGSFANNSWNKSHANASAFDTNKAYTAITGTQKGPTTDFSHIVWNDLNNWLGYLGNEMTGTDYSERVSKSTMTESPYILTANIWNNTRTLAQLIWITLNSGSSANVPYFHYASSNGADKVLGSYFTEITTTINNRINEV